MEGLEKTFGHIHKSSSEQTQKLGSLMIGLEKAFNSIHNGTQSRDKNSVSSLDQVSQTIIRSSEELRKEYEEMERLQEQKLAAEKERHQHSFNVLKIIAVPAIILAVLGIGYMFYTVTVMERAMTAMSSDMKAMRGSMSEMTTSVGGMNSNVQTMSQDMRGMRRDMGVLTHNVAPAMDGMRQMMPWAP
jgi:methyl-accepting chemotaxis protein